MENYKFDKSKNDWLKTNRGISFEDIIEAIGRQQLIRIINHPNKKKYPKQKIYLVIIKKYIFAVPLVEENEYKFLKTVYPSRKYTKKYLKNYKFSK